MEITDFSNDLTEYRETEKMIAEDFITGILRLGKILKEKRDKWKPKNRWTEYLENINKSMAGANQFIRLYEYSEKHLQELVSVNLTKWERINYFLALPEPLRLQLAQEINGQSITDPEFKANLENIKNELPKEVINPKDPLEKIIDQILYNRIEASAKALFELLRKKNKAVTEKSIPIIKGNLYLGRGMDCFSESNILALNATEKKCFLNLTLKQVEELKSVIRKMKT